MWARGFECARVARSLSSACLVSCWSVVFGSRHSCLEFWSTWRGSDTRAPFSVIVWVRGLEFARHRALLSTCVLLCCTQFVFLSAACSYVICCAVWHAAVYIHWLCAFMLSCVNTWLMSFLISCVFMSCLHMAGDLFAGHVLVFLFMWARGFCPSFLCATCSHVNLSWPHPILLPVYWFNFSPAVFPRYPSLICSLYNLLVFAVSVWVRYLMFDVVCVQPCPALYQPCPALPCC